MTRFYYVSRSKKNVLLVKGLITFANEVTFSSAFVCLLAGLRKNYSTDIHKIRPHLTVLHTAFV